MSLISTGFKSQCFFNHFPSSFHISYCLISPRAWILEIKREGRGRGEAGDRGGLSVPTAARTGGPYGRARSAGLEGSPRNGERPPGREGGCRPRGGRLAPGLPCETRTVPERPPHSVVGIATNAAEMAHIKRFELVGPGTEETINVLNT